MYITHHNLEDQKNEPYLEHSSKKFKDFNFIEESQDTRAGFFLQIYFEKYPPDMSIKSVILHQKTGLDYYKLLNIKHQDRNNQQNREELLKRYKIVLNCDFGNNQYYCKQGNSKSFDLIITPDYDDQEEMKFFEDLYFYHEKLIYQWHEQIEDKRSRLDITLMSFSSSVF